MTDFSASASSATELLASLGHTSALVGGFAVSVRAEPRFTRDIDLAVALADDAGAEAVCRSFVEHGHEVLATVEQAAQGRLATVRLRSADGDLLDLLFASSGIEGEIVAAAENVEVLPGLLLRVAQTGHLIALKLLSADGYTRPQDLADLTALHAVATAADLDLAAESVDLITERGYHRRRDLRGALADLRGD